MIKPFQTIKVRIGALIVFSLCATYCSSSKIKGSSSIRKIKFLYNLPLVNSEGELKNITDSFYIHYWRDDILYQLPYYVVEEDADTIISMEVAFNYFLHRKGATYGYFYDSVNAPRFKVMPVDSLLRRKAFYGSKIFNENNDSLVEAKRNEMTFPLVEKYISKSKPDYSYPDTTILYYTDKIKNLPISLSTYLDSVTGLKLCKARVLFNSQYYKGYSFKAPKREISFELREELVSDPKVPLLLFNRFKKEWTGR